MTERSSFEERPPFDDVVIALLRAALIDLRRADPERCLEAEDAPEIQ